LQGPRTVRIRGLGNLGQSRHRGRFALQDPTVLEPDLGSEGRAPTGRRNARAEQ